jgi:hypothetical protein
MEETKKTWQSNFLGQTFGQIRKNIQTLNSVKIKTFVGSLKPIVAVHMVKWT